MEEIFKDVNGKWSAKRVCGIAGVFFALVGFILKFWLDKENNVSEGLILGVLGASLGAISVGTFEKKKGNDTGGN